MMCRNKILLLSLLIIFAAFIFPVNSTFAQVGDIPIPSINVDVKSAENASELSTTLQILLLLAILSLAPAIIMMVTSFIRISIVLMFTRTALSTQQLPPNQILMALSLFLTFFIMYPTFDKIYTDAFVPFQEKKIGKEELFTKSVAPIRQFMFNQMNRRDGNTMRFFLELAKIEEVKNEDDIPTYVLVPAFMLSELRKAFEIGVLIFIPFIVIDIIVASVLLSMGIIFLPPVIVSLPFKIILFVLVDGWRLLVEKIILGFNI